MAVERDLAPWFRRPDTSWSSLFENMPLRGYPRFSTIINPGSPAEYVYYLDDGRVRVSTVGDSGDEKTLMILDKGNIFGHTAALNRMQCQFRIMAVTDCRVRYMPYDYFESRVFGNPLFSRLLAKDLATIIEYLIGHVRDIKFLDASERVAKYMCLLEHKYGIPTRQGTLLGIRFTHQEMAELVGVSRVTVCKVMNDMESQGIILKRKGHFYITDPARLRQLARLS